MPSKAQIDMFLENANLQSGKKYTKGTLELDRKARELGVRPCDICTTAKDPDKCGVRNCYPWYCWFKKCWTSIRKEAGVIK